MPSFELGEATIPLEELGRFARSLTASYLQMSRATLRSIISKPALIESMDLRRNSKEYTRTLLFGDSQISAWAIVWPPGSKTPIHDHHCSCCFGVLSGVLSELRFRSVDTRMVALDRILRRQAGFVTALLPSGENIHQMRNDGAEDAVSVHIYGFDHAVHPSSIRREYELAL